MEVFKIMLFVFAKKIMHKYLKISCLQKRGGVVGVGNQTFYIIYIINTGYAYEIYIYNRVIIYSMRVYIVKG